MPASGFPTCGVQDKLSTGGSERSNQKVKRCLRRPLRDFWLPVTDSCKNYMATLYVKGKHKVGENSASAKKEETAGLGWFAGWAGQ